MKFLSVLIGPNDSSFKDAEQKVVDEQASEHRYYEVEDGSNYNTLSWFSIDRKYPISFFG